MNALVRARELTWLKADIPEGQCRILTNARCLSEGVDVPALDAVMFLSPRSSAVDVVQSVGRVMRKAPGKDFGYIILPVAVPVGVDPADALRDNKRFRVVWEVLNALRAHDDRFEAIVQSINLNQGRDPPTGSSSTPPTTPPTTPILAAVQFPLFGLEQWRDSIYSRIVDRVGTREYWDQWAADVARMSEAQIVRIKAILAASTPQVTAAFDAFLDGLRANLNDSITADQAISMLSQHLITAPVFDALFGDSGFAASNPVSIGMQHMLDVLEGQGLETETESPRTVLHLRPPAGIRGHRRRRHAKPSSTTCTRSSSATRSPNKPNPSASSTHPSKSSTSSSASADQLSRAEFGQGLTDAGVTILDPFTGTGTFIVRLLESGIITKHDLARKYAGELWCNEIMLLAYYIACVNIETTYEAVTGRTASTCRSPARS